MAYQNNKKSGIRKPLGKYPLSSIHYPASSIQHPASRKGFTPTPIAIKYRLNKQLVWGFTLLEVLVAIAVFALIITAAAGTFASIQQAWRKQRNTLDLVQNARWAMEFMTNELRHSTTAATPGWMRVQTPGVGDRLEFGVDPEADNNSPRREINYRLAGVNTLQRRWRRRPPPPGWSFWIDGELLANLIVPNPDLITNTGLNRGFPPPDGSLDPVFIENNGLVTIELTVRPRPTQAAGPENRDYTLRTQVRVRN